MASSIPSILSRDLPVAAAAVLGAGGGGFISSLLFNNNDDNNTSCKCMTDSCMTGSNLYQAFGSFMSSKALCEASKDNKPNPFITPQPRETLIRKRVS